MSLMDMLREAVMASKGSAVRSEGATGNNGHYFKAENADYWTGTYYSRPQVLVFEAYKANKTAAETAGFGRVEKQSKDAVKWINELDLESEEVHFFALSSDNQANRIQEFLDRSMSAAKKMHIAV